MKLRKRNRQMRRRNCAPHTINALQKINVNTRWPIRAKVVCVNMNVAGADLTEIRAGNTRLGSAGTRVQMVVADLLVRDSSKVMLFPVDRHNHQQILILSQQCQSVFLLEMTWTTPSRLTIQPHFTLLQPTLHLTCTRYPLQQWQGKLSSSYKPVEMPQPLTREPAQQMLALTTLSCIHS